MKYIKAQCEGSLLKYSLDEPLVMNNTIYMFRLDASNFYEPYNSEWKEALAREKIGYQASFSNSKTGTDTIVPLIKETIEGKLCFSCKVPENELIREGRLYIAVQFFEPSDILDDPHIYIYNTAFVNNPPRIYPSSEFGTMIKIQEDSFLTSLLNNLSGGLTNDILIKQSELAYDFNWVSSVPGSLIYGGDGTFTDEGLSILLTPRAKDRLIRNEAITQDDNRIIIEPNNPAIYEGLQFVCKEAGSFSYNVNLDGSIISETFQITAGDQLISNGLTWSLITSTFSNINNVLVEKNNIQISNDTPILPGYRIVSGMQEANFTLASFGAENEPKTSEELKESFSYIREKLLEVYSKEETYNKKEVYSKEEVYNKNEVYNKEETQLICNQIITEAQINELYKKIDNLIAYAEEISF